MDVGRPSIAGTLIPYENAGTLGRANGDWYQYLFNKLGEHAVTPEDFATNELSIVTFNYDRSLEQFFRTALAHAYGLDDGQAVKLFRDSIPIVHVHGDLGDLWDDTSEDFRSYSPEVDYRAINVAAKRIKIISEEEQVESAFREAHALIGAAEKLAFLGFGYHPVNIERLRLGEFKGAVLGSGHGLEDAEIAQAKQRVGREFKILPLKASLYLRREPVLVDGGI